MADAVFLTGDALAVLKEVCVEIGCSGMDKRCPGDANCAILRKLIRLGRVSVAPRCSR